MEVVLYTRFGEMPEWSIGHAWNACVLQGTQGSNPCLSAQTAQFSLNPASLKTTLAMRKLLTLLIVFGLTLSASTLFAQGVDPNEGVTGFQLLKQYFIQGDWRFMMTVLICLILGLAFCLERVITLNIASVNTDKLLERINENLRSGDLEGAKEVCRSTQGPTASILYEGLNNAQDGPAAVEKAIVGYGAVQMGLLEKGLVWISLFIAIAPMLGFMGTVIGMIQAFDKIAATGELSPAVVATGIKVALLTTVFGLVVAIILQIFYNYIVSKIDSIVNRMEDASISLVDIMSTNNVFGKTSLKN